MLCAGAKVYRSMLHGDREDGSRFGDSNPRFFGGTGAATRGFWQVAWRRGLQRGRLTGGPRLFLDKDQGSGFFVSRERLDFLKVTRRPVTPFRQMAQRPV